jgi:hypothetical protein
LWEILAMQFIFSEGVPFNEGAAYQIEVLGADSFPEQWWQHWHGTGQYFEISDPWLETWLASSRSLGCRSVWPPLDDAWEEFVPKFRREDGDSCFA